MIAASIRALMFLIFAISSVYGVADSKGLEFLKSKEAEEGVVKLPSGLL